MEIKVGIGYDVHQLKEGRRLIIGGVEIPHEAGLLGHSDADVLVHAIMDALLGAMGMGDIGLLFPDTDDTYKDISSLTMLKEVNIIMKREKYQISNVDAVVIAQKPKLRPYIDSMERVIAEVLDVPSYKINVKATTEEGLGFSGACLGIGAKAICCLYK